MNREDMAMQTRCPHCLGEQYILNVIAFSEGENGCSVCGQRTTPMDRHDWYRVLAEKRASEPRR